MKTVLYPLLFAFTLIIGCGSEENPLVEQPTPNADSIRCVQAWQQFQLPEDTILTLRYQQPVEIINGSDKMTITVSQIDDFCTEDGQGTTYGCEAKVWLELTLNNKCNYSTRYGLIIGRRSARPLFENFSDFNCRYPLDDLLYDKPASVLLAFHKTVILLNRLTPFAKNLQEFNDLTAIKQKYAVTLWLKKRCF